MPHSIFGWDLPPGCRLSDIPGNRPEDEKWEAIEENFYNKERLLNPKYGTRITEKEYAQMDKLIDDLQTSDVITNYIMAAIEYGMDIGGKEAEDNRQENKYYETRFVEETLMKANVSEDIIKKVLDILGGNYETP